MPELEQTLTRIGRELDWPETPDLAASVTARLRAAGPAEAAAPAEAPGPAAAPPEAAHPPTERRLRRPDADKLDSRRGWGLLPPAGLRRALVLALVSLLVLAGGVFAAVPGVRDAVLEFFGLQGATVERRETLPAAPPPRPLELGTRTTIAEARGQLAFEPLVPADPGDPDGVYVSPRATGGELSLTYRPRAGLPRAESTRVGLLVTQFRGDLAPRLYGKLAGPAARIEPLRIDGERAVWLEGADHFFFYRAPDGTFVEDELRVAQNVLLVERGRLLVRLEGAFGLDRAVQIAESLR